MNPEQIRDLARRTIEKIRPSQVKSLELYANSKNPEIVSSREVIAHLLECDADIIADAITEALMTSEPTFLVRASDPHGAITVATHAQALSDEGDSAGATDVMEIAIAMKKWSDRKSSLPTP